MVEKKIHISDFEEAKLLVNHTMGCSFQIDLVSDWYVVDAKSIMSIFSLDMNKPILLRADCEQDNPLFDKIRPLVME